MKHSNEYRSVTELAKALNLPEGEARRIEIRTDLVVAIQRTITKKKLTHAESAKMTGVGRTVITALMNGNSKHISTDRLIHIAELLGLKVRLSVA